MATDIRADHRLPMGKWPDNFYSPKDAVTNKLFGGLADNSTVSVTTAENKKSKHTYGVVVKYSLNYEKLEQSPEILMGGTLDPYKQNVQDTIVTLMEAGNEEFTSRDINRVMQGNPNAKLTSQQAIEIARAMMSMRRREVTIVTANEGIDSNLKALWKKNHGNLEPESNLPGYKSVGKFYGGTILAFEESGVVEKKIKHTKNGETTEEVIAVPTRWKMLAMPLLYRYAKDKGQVSCTQMKLINYAGNSDEPKVIQQLSARRTKTLNVIEHYLLKDIDTMKKDHSYKTYRELNSDRGAKEKPIYSRIITWETFYKLDGLDKVKSKSLKNMKSRTRHKVDKLLTGYKEQGLIQAFSYVDKKKGGTKFSYGIEITL